MSTTEPAARPHPPRPPREATGPLLIHTPQGPPPEFREHYELTPTAARPAWIRGPPPQYHLAEAGHLIEPSKIPPAPAPEPQAKVRCPKCKETFEWAKRRPVQVECPHCGVKGLLR